MARESMSFAAVMAMALVGSAYADSPTGGSGLEASAVADDISPQLRAAIDAQLTRNVQELSRQGQLAPGSTPSLTGGFQWPLHPVPSFNDPGYHGVSNFVDLNPPNAASVLDWNCGVRSYALSPQQSPPAGYRKFAYPFQ